MEKQRLIEILRACYRVARNGPSIERALECEIIIRAIASNIRFNEGDRAGKLFESECGLED
jgi:hypothetical protein